MFYTNVNPVIRKNWTSPHNSEEDDSVHGGDGRGGDDRGDDDRDNRNWTSATGYATMHSPSRDTFRTLPDSHTSRSSLHTFRDNLRPCQGDLHTFQDNLRPCQGDLHTFQGSLRPCQGGLRTFRGNLRTSRNSRSCRDNDHTCLDDPHPHQDGYKCCHEAETFHFRMRAGFLA